MQSFLGEKAGAGHGKHHDSQAFCSFDDRAAEVYGDIVACAQRAGTRNNIGDGAIAAIALVHGVSIATRDVGDFEVAGASLVNP